MCRMINRFLAFSVVCCLILSLIPDRTAVTAEKDNIHATKNAKECVRQTVNFNREWKFVRKDIEGAELEKFNDSSWYNIGLPHDFSIPYWQEEKHYTGYGWYRKTFNVEQEWIGKRLSLDFAGVFHTAEIYVNENFVGEHRGGYTGFEFDITDYVRQGENTIAIRVNNIWQKDLAPRTGEHMFTGGIYRDVNLVITSPVHITWYGTFVQTPDISASGSGVRMQAEVKNDSEEPQNVRVAHKIYDADNEVVKSFESEDHTIAAGEVYNFDNTGEYISNPHLWSPDDPYMYKVITDVYVDGVPVDQYETPLGFRWMDWTADQGFFLNGEHFWIDGSNAHQDHAGWANAVTTAALKRDVAMIKEAGFNFIRGSHYPHSPAYAEACDEQGILFWSEAPFWCTSAWGEGTSEGTSKDYLADGYPTTGNRKTEETFEQSCLDSVRDMIRVNRNHPSVIIWSMGNEAFFGTNHDKKKKLISRMAAYAKELDPTRKVAMGGTQMGGYDKLENVDVAGYNGDGAEKKEYQNPGVPNMVSEYSTYTANRPSEFKPHYGSVATDENGDPLKPAWRSGHALWCTFHHGSILSRSYGDMGCVDYYRLPLQIWYYYRYKNTGVEREYSIDGTAAKLKLTASDKEITNDGTKDTHIIVTVEDADGNWVNEETELVFEVTDGPGIFPTGKTMRFKPGDSMRDGKAAIEFRSYYAGTTTIKAYAPDHPEIDPDTITITTTGTGSQAEPDISTMYGAFMSNGGVIPNTVEEPESYRFVNYKGCPMHASSGDSGENTCKNILDGDKQTEWKAETPGSGQWVSVELEHGGLNLFKAQLSFKGKKYPYKISYKTTNIDDPEWITLKEYDQKALDSAPVEESFGGVYMRYIRIEFTDVPADEYANLAELRLYGIRNEKEGYNTGETYISDVTWGDDLTDGVYMDSSAGSKKINLKGQEYDKGFGVKTNSEVVFDLEKHAPKYCRFKCRAGIDGESELNGEVKICVYEDEQLVYEKTINDKETVADIDISVNKVKALKLTVTSNTPGIYVDWADAKLTGVLRNISLDGQDLTAESFINMDTLIPGGELCINTDIKNKLESGRPLAGAVNLYAADGSLLSCKMVPAEVPENTKKNIKLAITVPADIAKGAYAVFAIWDKNTLIPLTETITIASSKETAVNDKSVLDTAREESQLRQAIKMAMDIIYPGDAEKYTLPSREGFTDKLLHGSDVLNDSELGQSDVDIAANEINEAIKNLKYVQNVSGGNANEQLSSNAGAGEQLPLNSQPPNKKKQGTVPKKGSIHKIGRLKYRILVSSTTKGAVTVYKPQSKSLRKVVIPAKVKINGYNFKVTEISNRAFYTNKKLVKVIIGKNIRKIGKKAFFGDSRLKNVDIQSRSLTRIGTNAFAKAHKKLTIKIPKSKKKAYRKKLALSFGKKSTSMSTIVKFH